MTKQLTIRSDEAHALASDFAERLHTDVTDVVVRALRAFGAQIAPSDTMNPDQQFEFEALQALSKRGAALKAPGATSDHSEFYDAFGLPK